MLLSFTVNNYLSFKNEVVLSMIPASIKEHEDNIAVLNTINSKVLKSAAIYGANSSGKSNLLKALIFMKRFVLNSSKNSQVNESIDVESFRLNSVNERKPSEFEVVFFHKGIRYRYGFRVDNFVIYKEWLHFSKVTKEYVYFERHGSKIVVDEKAFPEGMGLENKTRPNALFLSVVAQFNGEIAMNLLEWFNDLKYINDTNKQYHQNKTSQLLATEGYKNWITKFLDYADLGFSQVVMEKLNVGELDGLPKQIRDMFLSQTKGDTIIRTLHTQYDDDNKEVGKVLFNLNKNESLGTQKFFSMAGLIIDCLASGKVLIIDELDARLHPNLSLAIISLFNSKINNPKNAQLIFVTHNSNLLSRKIFRRDQIIFAEKDRVYGNTTLHTLNEKARNDEAFEKNYLLGEYGAIPKIENQLNLFDSLL